MGILLNHQGFVLFQTLQEGLAGLVIGLGLRGGEPFFAAHRQPQGVNFSP